MKIKPAILVNNLIEYTRQLEAAFSYTDEVDVDIIDWQRTSNKTINVDQALSVPTPLILNFDLMVDHPSPMLRELLVDPRVKYIIMNPECKENITDLLPEIKESGKHPAISINPDNKLDQILPFLTLVEMVQIFTIEPGAQGNNFLPQRLELITALKEKGFIGQIEVDGGFNQTTAHIYTQFPLDIISVGSALAKSADPKTEFAALTNLLPK